jgi:hypothetical protein
MRGRRETRGWLAALLAIGLVVASLPARAAGGTIQGTVLSAGDQSPRAGLTVFAADAATGQIYRSAPSSAEGAFVITELPAARFDLAVGDERHLYVVATPVTLAGEATQHLNLALAEQPGTSAGAGTTAAPPRGRVWDNPLTASLIVVGSAIAVGAIVNAATDDEDDASPN